MDGTNCSFEVLTSGRTTPAPWEALIEPSNIFAHPGEVLAAVHLSDAEKRAVLASRASDASAVESDPTRRHCPGIPGCHVSLSAVLDALNVLDARGKDGRRR